MNIYKKNRGYEMKKRLILCMVVLIIIIAVAFFAKSAKANKLVAEEITEIVLISPPFEKKIINNREIEAFVELYNNRKKMRKFSIGNSSGWSKRAIISMGKQQYDIIFSGRNILVNKRKYIIDVSIDSELDEFYHSLNEPELNY